MNQTTPAELRGLIADMKRIQADKFPHKQDPARRFIARVICGLRAQLATAQRMEVQA